MGVRPLGELVQRRSGPARQRLKDEELGAADPRVALGLAGAETQVADDLPERVEDLPDAAAPPEPAVRWQHLVTWDPIESMF